MGASKAAGAELKISLGSFLKQQVKVGGRRSEPLLRSRRTATGCDASAVGSGSSSLQNLGSPPVHIGSVVVQPPQKLVLPFKLADVKVVPRATRLANPLKSGNPAGGPIETPAPANTTRRPSRRAFSNRSGNSTPAIFNVLSLGLLWRIKVSEGDEMPWSCPTWARLEPVPPAMLTPRSKGPVEPARLRSQVGH